MIRLDCLLDNCAKDQRPVDYRLCCSCEHFTESEEFGSVGCSHSLAKRAPEEVRQTNRAVFKATPAGIGHLLYCGPARR